MPKYVCISPLIDVFPIISPSQTHEITMDIVIVISIKVTPVQPQIDANLILQWYCWSDIP